MIKEIKCDSYNNEMEADRIEKIYIANGWIRYYGDFRQKDPKIKNYEKLSIRSRGGLSGGKFYKASTRRLIRPKNKSLGDELLYGN